MHVSGSRLDSRQKLPSWGTEISKRFKASSQVCNLKQQALKTQIENLGKKMHGSSHQLLNHNYSSSGQFLMLLIHDGFAAFTAINLSNPLNFLSSSGTTLSWGLMFLLPFLWALLCLLINIGSPWSSVLGLFSSHFAYSSPMISSSGLWLVFHYLLLNPRSSSPSSHSQLKIIQGSLRTLGLMCIETTVTPLVPEFWLRNGYRASKSML